MTLRLEDCLSLLSQDFGQIKVKFNNWTGENPIDSYLRDSEEVNNRNLFWRSNRRYFSVGDVALNFIRLDHDKWLLTTIKKVTRELGVRYGQNYEGETLEQFSDYFGRLVIRYKKQGRLSVRSYLSIMDDLEIDQLLPEAYSGSDFQGYDDICLSYTQLERIFRLEKRDWLTALKNQKAVYLITDRKTGKLYVGSATSDYGMLLSRWSSYVANGHGGNKELKALVEKEGFDYVKTHFQYSLLENYNGKIDDYFVLERESWWKKVLQSREFGYNAN